MKMLRRSGFIVVLFAVIFISTLSAHAALELRGTDSLGNRLIYDTDLNITWYDYTMSPNSWQNQVNWATGLSVDFGGSIYNDWRLPTTVDGPSVWGYDGTTTAGYNITSSEMGHLFFTELGNEAYQAIDGTSPLPGWGIPYTGWGLTNTGDFQDLLSNNYWSGTEYSANPSDAWSFDLEYGRQYNTSKNASHYYAIAVRPGDVSVSVAPEPVSMILFGVGGVVMGARRMVIRWRG